MIQVKKEGGLAFIFNELICFNIQTHLPFQIFANRQHMLLHGGIFLPLLFPVLFVALWKAKGHGSQWYKFAHATVILCFMTILCFNLYQLVPCSDCQNYVRAI